MKTANQAIERERHTVPIVENLIVDLNGATVFSKIDLNQGYHQLKLAEDSRSITVFATHVGLFRYKRLRFGITQQLKSFRNPLKKCCKELKMLRTYQMT